MGDKFEEKAKEDKHVRKVVRMRMSSALPAAGLADDLNLVTRVLLKVRCRRLALTWRISWRT